MKARLVLLAAVLVLTACPAVDDDDPRATATCSLGGLEANPAGLHRSGSVGGVALEGDPELAASDVVPLEVVAGVASEPFAAGGPRHDVVLVVADDFGALQHEGASVYRLGPDVYATSYRDYLLASEDTDLTYPAWLEERLDVLVADGQLSHGALVLTHALGLFRERGAAMVEDGDELMVLELGNAQVVVAAVEVSGLTAQEVAEALAEATDTYRSQGFERFVVNMSFTLEPCEPVRAFRRDMASSFDAFLSATPPSIGPGDPLYDFVHADTRDTVFIAAAGNHGGSQPRQPGLMTEVVSVSASRGSDHEPFEQSNDGEVRTPGVWVPLANPFGRNDQGDPSGEVLLGGTSLAAPAASLASVIDAGAESVRCVDPVSGSRLAHGAYTNLTLAAAVDEFCLAVP